MAKLDRKWQFYAECAIRKIDPELYTKADTNASIARRLRVVCNVCKVKSTCLSENLYVPYGLFGGLTARQRREITGISNETRGFFDTRVPAHR